MAICASARAQAADEPRELLKPPEEAKKNPITDRFAISGIYYQPSVETGIRYDRSATLPGTPISAEDTLGMDDALNQGTMQMMFRMAPKHRLRVDYYKMTRKGEATLDELVIFGNDTFLPGDDVVSSMDLRLLGLTYTYSIFRRERWELALGLGLHLMEIKGEAEVPARFVGETFDTAGPFASAAVDGTFLITKRFSFNARAQYFTGDASDVDASYGNYHADVQFRAWPNLSFGLGYTSMSMRIDSTDVDFSGRFTLKTRGPEAFVRVSF
jgi:hypothetical protein